MSIDLKEDNGQYYSKDYFSEIKKISCQLVCKIYILKRDKQLLTI